MEKSSPNDTQTIFVLTPQGVESFLSGNMVEDRPHTLSTNGEYELYFINTVETYGLNAESVENQPMKTVSYIWKYINKSKTRVAQYEYLHTYKNQNDINSQSLEVCGKKISHTNVAPKLKEWKQVSKEEFVWIKVTA